jgi:murein L,D-transpeptidase YafK
MRRLLLLVASLVVVALAVLLLLEAMAGRLPEGATADALLVEKAARRLTLLRDGKAIAAYRIALGSEPVGAKEREGDGRTPEGRYRIDFHKADSAYHLALHVSYPEEGDRERARRLGVDPGGAIMIHGIRNGLGWLGPLHRVLDWTRGCVALTNREIEEVYRAVPDGTAVEIVP